MGGGGGGTEECHSLTDVGGGPKCFEKLTNIIWMAPYLEKYLKHNVSTWTFFVFV